MPAGCQEAVDLCMNSAAAYKAAFMLADNAWDERRLLDLCTARYALLECLLGQLGGTNGCSGNARYPGSGPAPGRFTIRPSMRPLPPP